MHLPPITSQPADAARPVRLAAPPPQPVEKLYGEAQPDVLALPGGSLVQDGNRNGFVDGDDTVVRSSSLPWPSLHVDVRG
jgi:hypothetical protein